MNRAIDVMDVYDEDEDSNLVEKRDRINLLATATTTATTSQGNVLLPHLDDNQNISGRWTLNMRLKLLLTALFGKPPMAATNTTTSTTKSTTPTAQATIRVPSIVRCDCYWSIKEELNDIKLYLRQSDARFISIQKATTIATRKMEIAKQEKERKEAEETKTSSCTLQNGITSTNSVDDTEASPRTKIPKKYTTYNFSTFDSKTTLKNKRVDEKPIIAKNKKLIVSKMLFVTSRQYECGNQLLSSQDATFLLQHMSAILKMDNHMILHVTEDLLNIVDMTMRGKNQSIYLYRAVKESLICTKIYF